MEYSTGQMNLPMKKIGRMESCMEKESIITLMAVYVKVTFRMVSNVAKE